MIYWHAAPADLMTMPLSPPPPLSSAASRPGRVQADAALRRDTARALACMALLLVAMAALSTMTAGLSMGFVPKALAVFGIAAAFMWRGLPAHAPLRRFGAANTLTLFRLSLIALLAAGAGEAIAGDAPVAWAAVVIATVAALLDAADGPIARRRGEASAFGARFDMETDALLIAVLSVLVLQLDQAGAWVLAAGAMRYAFVAAAAVWPWLAQPLFPSTRRKVVCVVQIVSLIVCLGPIIDPWLARAIAGAGLLALAYSFAVDIVWLARRRQQVQEASA
ncbi:MAG: CDP-alcohol phosphatidyltransferase family protein [Variovorax sp.]|nr:MAG: CDP-alcohol phosphatidyltransferase family protein [Variovorax sp.]